MMNYQICEKIVLKRYLNRLGITLYKTKIISLNFLFYMNMLKKKKNVKEFIIEVKGSKEDYTV